MIDLPPDAALIADTPRLRLVPLTVEDAPELFGVLNDERLHEFRGGHPLDEVELADLFRRLQGRRSPDGEEVLCTWVVRLVPLGEAVGMLQATVTDDGLAVVDCVMGTKWSGRGFALEALTAMVRLLQAHLGVTRLEARVHPAHAAAVRLASRLGLERQAHGHGREVWTGACDDPVLSGWLLAPSGSEARPGPAAG